LLFKKASPYGDFTIDWLMVLPPEQGVLKKNNVIQVASIFMNPGTPESFIKDRQRLKPGRRLFFVDNPTRMI